MSQWKEITTHEWKGNPFEAIGKQWMLITAGNEDKCNTMTASWGSLGVLWNKDVSFTFIRHSRYTFEFAEREEYYSLCFFPEDYRPALSLCGRVSGRDTDKIADAGLTPVFDKEAPYFAEAETVMICRKIYADEVEAKDFLDDKINDCYPTKDYHKMYIGEIVRVMVKE